MTYDARSVEVQQARVMGVELHQRERVGPDLEELVLDLQPFHVHLARGIAGGVVAGVQTGDGGQ